MSPEKLKLYCVASGNKDKLREVKGGYKLKSWRIDLVCVEGGKSEQKR